jgi:nucleoid-associated protein YgaU
MLVALVASLAIDLALEGCARLVHGRYGMPRPIRKLVASAVVVTVVWSMRPATGIAVVPPPSVRITGVEPGAPADSGVDLGTHPPLARTPSPYVVEPGDCLWRIARRLLAERYGTASSTEVAVLWRSIYEANRGVIGDDPDLILPGQALALPGGW